nr:contact-dependent growth inhibition system immunity protein [Acinetobacter seifertii]
MKRATVYFNNKYIEVISWNYGGMSVFNLDFIPLVLKFDIDNSTLGKSIKIALDAGRKISPESVKDFLFSPELDIFMKERTEKLIAGFGYKSKKTLFKNMRKVGVDFNENYTISPISSRWARL